MSINRKEDQYEKAVDVTLCHAHGGRHVNTCFWGNAAGGAFTLHWADANHSQKEKEEKEQGYNVAGSVRSNRSRRRRGLWKQRVHNVPATCQVT